MLYGLPNHLPSSSFGIAFKVRLLTARKIFLLYSRTSFLNPKQNCWCSLHLTPCSFSKSIFLYWIKISHYFKKKKCSKDLAVPLKTIIKRGHPILDWAMGPSLKWIFYTLQDDHFENFDFDKCLVILIKINTLPCGHILNICLSFLYEITVSCSSAY